MKFRTKLAITFFTVILLPVLLLLVAFMTIGTVLVRSSNQSLGVEATDLRRMSDSIEAFSHSTDDLFHKISDVANETPDKLEDRAYLEQLNAEAVQRSSYLIVRREEAQFYTGNASASAIIFDRLPQYGQESDRKTDRF